MPARRRVVLGTGFYDFTRHVHITSDPYEKDSFRLYRIRGPMGTKVRLVAEVIE